MLAERESMRIEIEMLGADLSTAQYSKPFNLRTARRFGIALGIPAGVSGAMIVQVHGHGRSGVAGQPLYTPTTQPTGTAMTMVIDGLTTDQPFGQLRWVPSSGGVAQS